MTRVNVAPVDLPVTPRLAAEAAKWARWGRRPDHIVAPGPEQESVWDYPRPPQLQRVLDRVVIEFAGQRIVDTLAALRVCETASPPTYYVPIAELPVGALLPAPGTSLCEWKGRAVYHSLLVAGQRAERCAWSYPTPTLEYEPLRGLVGFYAGRVDRCWVGGAPVTPQAGGFYAGWVTPDLVGPFKGEPGSEGW